LVLHGTPPQLRLALDAFWPGLTAIEVTLS
jgi:hypothetical protein